MLTRANGHVTGGRAAWIVPTFLPPEFPMRNNQLTRNATLASPRLNPVLGTIILSWGWGRRTNVIPIVPAASLRAVLPPYPAIDALVPRAGELLHATLPREIEIGIGIAVPGIPVIVVVPIGIAVVSIGIIAEAEAQIPTEVTVPVKAPVKVPMKAPMYRAEASMDRSRAPASTPASSKSSDSTPCPLHRDRRPVSQPSRGA